MAPIITDVPQLIFKPSIKMTQWTPTIKCLMMILVSLMYIYMTLLLLMFYFKNKRLDGIMEMADETQILINRLHAADDSLLQQLEEIPEY